MTHKLNIEVSSIYQYLQSQGFNPEWVAEGESFRQIVCSGNVEFELLVYQDTTHIVFVAPWISLAGVSAKKRQKLYKHYLAENMALDRQVFFAFDHIVDAICVRGNGFISGDLEENLDTYMVMRDAFIQAFQSRESFILMLDDENK